MTQGILIRLLICICTLGGVLCLYIDKQNEVTERKMQIPKLARRLHTLEEENAQLHYEVERLENPERLICLLRKPEFSHLKQPLLNDVMIIHAN